MWLDGAVQDCCLLSFKTMTNALQPIKETPALPLILKSDEELDVQPDINPTRTMREYQKKGAYGLDLIFNEHDHHRDNKDNMDSPGS